MCPLVKPGSGGGAAKGRHDDCREVEGRIGGTTSLLKSALDANIDLAQLNKDLELENEAAN